MQIVLERSFTIWLKGNNMASFGVRCVTLTAAAVAMAVAPAIGMATANAEHSIHPDVSFTERGQVRAHTVSIVRSVKTGAINGGQESKGLPIIISDGNPASLPCLTTSNWTTKGQDWAYNSNFAC